MWVSTHILCAMCVCLVSEDSSCSSKRADSVTADNEPAQLFRQVSQTYRGNMVVLEATRASAVDFKFLVGISDGVEVRSAPPALYKCCNIPCSSVLLPSTIPSEYSVIMSVKRIGEETFGDSGLKDG